MLAFCLVTPPFLLIAELNIQETNYTSIEYLRWQKDRNRRLTYAHLCKQTILYAWKLPIKYI